MWNSKESNYYLHVCTHKQMWEREGEGEINISKLKACVELKKKQATMTRATDTHTCSHVHTQSHAGKHTHMHPPAQGGRKGGGRESRLSNWFPS